VAAPPPSTDPSGQPSPANFFLIIPPGIFAKAAVDSGSFRSTASYLKLADGVVRRRAGCDDQCSSTAVVAFGSSMAIG